MTTTISPPARPRDRCMILSPDQFELSDLHDQFRQTYRAGLSPEWFGYEVCNNVMSLPEAKLGLQWHVPACRPQTMDGLGYGWHVSDFVIVMPSVNLTDVNFRTCLTSRPGQLLMEKMRDAGLDLEQLMITHANRFALPNGLTSYSQAHKKACRAYAQLDCFGCQPRAILTCGSDALKVLFGKNAKLDSYRGGVHEWMGIPVIPTCSPAVFTDTLAGIEVFESEIGRLMDVTLKKYVNGASWQEGYRVCKTAEEVEALEAHLVTIGVDAGKVSIDTEYGNTTGREEHNCLRSIQVGWGPGQAAFIKLRGVGMTICHTDEEMERIKASVTRMLGSKDNRLEGFHLRTDVDMPSREGMHFEHKLETGFCAMLARNLLHGSDGDESDGLDHLVRRYVPQFGNYWKPLEDWLDANGRKENLQFGYANIPDEILILYALIDADATWQAIRFVEAELETKPKLKALFYNISMPTAVHLMDVEKHGLRQDRERVREIREKYEPEYVKILAEFRAAINWPDFNPNSKDQKASFLFAKSIYRDKKDAPEGAKTLELAPLYNTDKYPREWDKILADKEEARHFPSTKATTIELLWQLHKEIPELKMLKHLSVLGKFLSTYLAESELNDLGYPADGRKIVNNIWADGRVRTHFHQISATGRYRSFKPNLQTNPKKQEEAALSVFVERYIDITIEEYKQRTDESKKAELGCRYIPEEQRFVFPAYKSCYVTDKDHVFIEVDFKTAELCVLAYCSGDTVLAEILDSGRDLHAETACRAFKLSHTKNLDEALIERKNGNEKPYRLWLAHIKEHYTALRTAAKAVNFGIIYGRGSMAIARECNKTGADVTMEDCEIIIKGFSESYPKAWAWLQANKQSAIDNEFVEDAFGHCRYFKGISQMREQDQAKVKREASNSPVQGCVAFLLAVAGVLLHRVRYGTEQGRRIGFRVVLPIHDAFLIEVHKDHIQEMKQIIKMCMSTLNVIPGTGRSLDVDIEVYRHRWGESEAEVDGKRYSAVEFWRTFCPKYRTVDTVIKKLKKGISPEDIIAYQEA